VAPRYNDIARSRELMEAQLKAFIGRNTVLEDNGYYLSIYPEDNVIMRALDVLNQENQEP
jgi:carboxyl-terminal processing protease